MNIAISTADEIFRELENVLTEKGGVGLRGKIEPILRINIERGRIDVLEPTSKAQVLEYLNRFVDNFRENVEFVEALQVKRDETLWKALFNRLVKWAYTYLVRKNFEQTLNTREIAMGQATEAAMQILNSHFPYDVKFDFWAHRLLINTCAKYLRNQGRKALPTIKQSVEELEEALKSPENPELQIERKFFFKHLNRALESLAPARARVIRGYYFQGKNFGELANELDKSMAAIHSLHFRGLSDLRAQLKLEGFENE